MSMSNSIINICSLNTRGLGDYKKRRDVLNYLRMNKYSIICLQDTHFTQNMLAQINREWGYTCYHSTFSSNSRGTSIFITNTFEFKPNNCIEDPNGNFIILDCNIEDHRILVVTIYAPNKDTPSYFQELQNKISSLNIPNIIIVGDWNLILDSTQDCKNYKHINNPNARKKVIEMKLHLNLIDIWRESNALKRQYTWKKKLTNGELQAARLDFFLVSETLLQYTYEEKISAGYRSDHSIVSMNIRFNKGLKGRGFWKFNNSLLCDIDYVNLVKNTIREVKKQYGALPYNFENIDEISNTIYQCVINEQLFFEVLLMEIRSKTIAFSIQKKRTTNNKMNDLVNEINDLENNNSPLEEIDAKKLELQNLRNKIMEGVLIRSRARWINEGEKPTQYFCNMENRHFLSKHMKVIIDNEGRHLDNQKDISDEVRQYYKNLYSKHEDKIEDNISLNHVLNQDTKKLSDEECIPLKGLLSLTEATEALKNMNNHKSPGSDGFTVEFFKFFWRDIGNFWLKAANESLSKGILPCTQREGLIITIPKGNKDKKYLKNWRPITLLNVAYKIASSCIANRIKKVLPQIISPDQCGFMSGRFAGDNIRLVYDILHHSNATKTGINDLDRF